MDKKNYLKLDIKNIKKIHFIGIGGIMMSAVAKIFIAYGRQVSGSDQSESAITIELQKLGVRYYLGHKKENIEPDVNLIIYTMAISQTNEEFLEAKKLGIPVMSVYQVLGWLSKNKYTLTVSGMHGKTTTTAMLGLTLIEAGFDPTIFVGSMAKNFGSNVRVGSSDYFVSEACEYRGNFLEYQPQVAIITNIEAEHLDYFKNLENIILTFNKFVAQISKKGFLIANGDDDNVRLVAATAKSRIVYYGLDSELLKTTTIKPKVNLDFKVKEIIRENNGTSFQVISKYFKKTEIFFIKVFGLHNVYNALAVIAAATILKVKPDVIRIALEKFSGTWRRLEYKGTKKKIILYDDYAHHPTEVKASLSALREQFTDKKIIVIFQPHLFSRTKEFLKEFALSFYDADEVILTDIYAAREENNKDINSKMLAAEIKKINKKTYYCPSFSDILLYLHNHLLGEEVVVTMGAGDIYKVGEMYLKNKIKH